MEFFTVSCQVFRMLVTDVNAWFSLCMAAAEGRPLEELVSLGAAVDDSETPQRRLSIERPADLIP
jgi:hypothetical protein